MIVASSGGDPHLSFKLPAELAEEELVLKLTMASRSKGSGRVFWQEQGSSPAFFRDRSRSFEVQHDGEPHDYSISWSAENPVLAVRIDPSTAPGEITISKIRLIDGEGQEIYRWKL